MKWQKYYKNEGWIVFFTNFDSIFFLNKESSYLSSESDISEWKIVLISKLKCKPLWKKILVVQISILNDVFSWKSLMKRYRSKFLYKRVSLTLRLVKIN